MTPLIICDDVDALNLMEIAAIEAYGTQMPNGYNMSPGGDMRVREDMVCSHCGEDFDGVPGVSEYCSNACKSASRRESGVDLEERGCENCGRDFKINKYWGNKTCSPTCRGQMRQGTTVGGSL